jgi:hypothetical protein
MPTTTVSGLRPISRLGAERLTEQSVCSIVKAYAELIGFKAADFGAHSPRAGFLTSAARRGDAGWVSIPRAPSSPNLSLSLAYSGGMSECIFHSVPDMVWNFYTVSARPGHERNLMVPDLTAHSRDGVAEGQDRFWIPCGRSRLELS